MWILFADPTLIFYKSEVYILKEIGFHEIEGIRIGSAQSTEGATGCTVIICEKGATGGVDVRGGAPGTRETDLLNPLNLVEKVNAVVLAGGSAFGLDASSGVMDYLEKNNIGMDVQVTKVPIVCSAVLFDLTCGSPFIRPDREMGYQACRTSEGFPKVESGCFGAGTGATVGKLLGPDYAMKGGLGSCCIQTGDLKVGAIVAVNCLGDVIDPETGRIIAGLYDKNNKRFLNTELSMISQFDDKKDLFSGNTTIGCIATNAIMTKSQSNKAASMAHNGYGRAIRPAHTLFDGDTIFTMATGYVKADVNVVGAMAAMAMEKAVADAVKSAATAYGYLGYADLNS
jgi:L-aminopeptidase/D-esterase-like protein